MSRYKCYKINLKCGGSYIDFPDWIKNIKVTINPFSDDDKCFQYVQYAATVALNHEQIEKKLTKNIKLSLLSINITGKE